MVLQLDLRVFITILLLDWHWYFEIGIKRVGNTKYSVIPPLAQKNHRNCSQQ